MSVEIFSPAALLYEKSRLKRLVIDVESVACDNGACTIPSASLHVCRSVHMT